MKNRLIFGLLFVACSPNVVQRTGIRYPAFPSGCPVAYLENSNSVDQGDYETLGNMTLSDTDGFSAEAKKKLGTLTCEWGGTAVKILSSASGSMAFASTATTFSILRKRESVPAGAKLACAGTFVNTDGATVEIKAEGTATMAFHENTSTCKAKALGGAKLLLDCGSGFNQEGAFASDCGGVEFGGMTFSAKK